MSIKNRIFGSDIPVLIKKKLEARQLLAEKNRAFGQKIEDENQKSTSDYKDSRKANYSYSELNKSHFDITHQVDGEDAGYGGVADLSQRTPFVRMWCSLGAHEKVVLDDGKEYTIEDQRLMMKDLKDNEFFQNNIKHEWKKLGTEKVYTLGNNVLNFQPGFGDTVEEKEKSILEGPKSFQTRASEDVLNFAMPDEQSIDNNMFMKPGAGITSCKSKTEGALGWSKRTTVEFTVHNFHDFQQIYLKYFLRPGALLFVDFGWDTSYLYEPETLMENPSAIDDFLFGDEGVVTISAGDLEVNYGNVVDYTATVREDGGFDCSVEIVSKNQALVEHKMTSKEFRDQFGHALDVETLAYILDIVYPGTDVYAYAVQSSQIKDDELRNSLSVNMADITLALGTDTKLPGYGSDTNAYTTIDTGYHASRFGVFIKGVELDSQKIYLNWGWFEDKILNRFFGYADELDDLIHPNADNISTTEGQLFAKFNSRQSWACFNQSLRDNIMGNKASNANAMDSLEVLYPMNWDYTYNTIAGATPDRFENEYGISDKKEIIDQFSNEAYLKMQADGDVTKKDMEMKRIPFRELWISTKLIKEAVDDATDVRDLLDHLFKAIQRGTARDNTLENGLVRPDMRSTSIGCNSISIIDKNYLLEDVLGNTSVFEKLFVFKPHSPRSLVKNYTLDFAMPDNGMGNMIAIQSKIDLDTVVSVDEVLDGLVSLEKVQRKTPELTDTFVKYNPSQGAYAAKRFDSRFEDFQTFSFSKDETLFNEMLRNPQTQQIMSVNLTTSQQDKIDTAISSMKTKISEAVNVVLEDSKVKGGDEDDVVEVKSSALIARECGQKMFSAPYQYWNMVQAAEQSTQVAPLINLDMGLTIHGISSLIPGDLIRCDYMPDNYFDNVFFQITGIEHDISSTWETTIQSQMRVDPKLRGIPNQDFCVNRDFLASGKRLYQIDKQIDIKDDKYYWKKWIKNLKPVNGMDLSPYDHIDAGFETCWINEVPEKAFSIELPSHHTGTYTNRLKYIQSLTGDANMADGGLFGVETADTNSSSWTNYGKQLTGGGVQVDYDYQDSFSAWGHSNTKSPPCVKMTIKPISTGVEGWDTNNTFYIFTSMHSGFDDKGGLTRQWVLWPYYPLEESGGMKGELELINALFAQSSNPGELRSEVAYANAYAQWKKYDDARNVWLAERQKVKDKEWINFFPVRAGYAGPSQEDIDAWRKNAKQKWENSTTEAGHKWNIQEKYPPKPEPKKSDYQESED